MRVQPLSDVGDHVGVGHGVPHPVGPDDDELPLGVEAKSLDLRHNTDNLFPGRFFVLGFEEKVAKTSGRDEDPANPESNLF